MKKILILTLLLLLASCSQTGKDNTMVETNEKGHKVINELPINKSVGEF